MATKAVLILGGSGFIGTHLALRLRDYYKVFATYFTNKYSVPGTTYIPFSIENKLWIKRILHTIQPDAIIYLIGSNDLAWVDKKPRLAESLHSIGPGALVNPSELNQPQVIYISNPYVFDGTKGNYKELDIIMPNSVMGRVKIEGENLIKSKLFNYVIVRSSPLFGRGNGLGLTFFDRLRMALSTQQRHYALQQEIHSFAPVQGLTEAIHRIIELGIRNKTLNYGGITKVSHFEFARLFAKHFKLNPALVTPRKLGAISTFDQNLTLDFSLNSSATTELLKIKPLLLEESFDLINQNLIPTA
jgi:dTDP-4-dehydrorhamnose reductase